MKSLKILPIGLIFFSLFFIAPKASYAVNFSTDYKVTYAVSENASTRVTFDVSLTNTTSRYYASSYKLILGFTDVQAVTAQDSLGQITPEVDSVKEGTQVEVTFNDKVVGLGKKQNFSISFDTSEIAEHSGNVWEVNIPGISKQNDFSNFNVTVVPPNSAQNLVYIKPQVNVNQNANVITFNQNQLGNSGISIAYGDYQVYKFKLNYHLKNGNLFPVKTEIAIPPNTNYQDIEISNINPAPDEVKKDIDGNWLVEFSLAPMKDVTASVEGYSKIFLKPRKEAISEEQISLYTKSLPYWESTDAQVKKLAKTLKTPRQIYDYVVSNLTYDFSRVKSQQVRLGASKIIKNPSSAVCLEFTDLFIGIARAAGIPAREVEGFANTQNSKERPLSLVEDILHAWPEYYDFEKKTWIMVDPTWANTTKGVDYFNVLDLDHFAFAIKGASSEYPIPAGGYKQKGQENVKDVLVEVQSVFPATRKSVEAGIITSSNHVSYLPIRGNVIFKNIGNVPSDPQVASLRADLNPSLIQFNVPALLPYEERSIAFSLRTNAPFASGIKEVKLETPSQVVVKSIKISLVSIGMLSIIVGGLFFVIVIIIVSIIAYRSWRLYVSRRERKSNLRGQSEQP